MVGRREGAVVGAQHGEGLLVQLMAGVVSNRGQEGEAQATACWHQWQMPHHHLRWCAGAQRVARELEAGAAEGSHLPQQVRVS